MVGLGVKRQRRAAGSYFLKARVFGYTTLYHNSCGKKKKEITLFPY